MKNKISDEGAIKILESVCQTLYNCSYIKNSNNPFVVKYYLRSYFRTSTSYEQSSIPEGKRYQCKISLSELKFGSAFKKQEAPRRTQKIRNNSLCLMVIFN